MLVIAVPAQGGPLINLVQNGSFTTTSLPSPGGYICQAGSTCVSNVAYWSSTCNAGGCGTGATAASLLYPGTNGSAFNCCGLQGTITDSPDGGNFLAIDGDTNYGASISQLIGGLTIGQNYFLSFYQGAAQQNGTSGPTTERWKVTFGSDTVLSTKMINPDGGVQPWNLQSFTFKATSTSQLLTFLAVGTPNGAPPVVLLDGVKIVAPEPGTFAFLAGGIVALIAARKAGKSRAR